MKWHDQKSAERNDQQKLRKCGGKKERQEPRGIGTRQESCQL